MNDQTGYIPSYAMYSKAPEGYHDEVFEYCFTFQATFTPPLASSSQANQFNVPLTFDPDADFYLRGIAVLIDGAPSGTQRIDFSIRIRDPWGRPLDDNFVPMQVYATNPFPDGPFPGIAGAPSATPVPELYCPKSCVMYMDMEGQ